MGGICKLVGVVGLVIGDDFRGRFIYYIVRVGIRVVVMFLSSKIRWDFS